MAKYGSKTICKLIIETLENLDQDLTLNAKNRNGLTPFLLACANGHLKTAEIIMQKSADLNIVLDAKTTSGSTAFHLASKNGHIDIFKMLMKIPEFIYNIGLNEKTLTGDTAFHMACENGHSKILDLIIQKSAELNIDLNTKTSSGSTIQLVLS